MSGHIFETWCVSEILKSYRNAGKRAPLYFYRDFDQAEIDLVIEQDGILYPVEIKKSTNPGRDAAKNFAKLEKFGKPVGKGAVICMESHPRCQPVMHFDFFRKRKTSLILRNIPRKSNVS